jgi:ribosomal protein S18 acetylase RimI-like enzyme
MALSFSIQSIAEADRTWIKHFLSDQWGSSQVVSRGLVHDADMLPGFIARSTQDIHLHESGKPVGLITYTILGKACEIVTLDSLSEGIGIGTQLILAVESTARKSGCTRVWLITTNDNTQALRFYQKRGFQLAALYRDAIQQSRLLKPAIPLIGMDNIPIRDEIELEKILKEGLATQAESRPGVSSPGGKPS